jgi:hypothetical protein
LTAQAGGNNPHSHLLLSLVVIFTQSIQLSKIIESDINRFRPGAA